MTDTKDTTVQVRTSREFADLMLELSRDSNQSIREFIDKHYLPDAKKRHEKMLRRKLAAHAHDLGGES